LKAKSRFHNNHLEFAKTTRLSELLFFTVFVNAGLLNGGVFRTRYNQRQNSLWL